MKTPTFKENREERRWNITLDHDEMRALVSMVRLEMGSGWTGVEPKVTEAGIRLCEEIEKVY